MSEGSLTFFNAVIFMISSTLGCGVIFLPLSFKILGNLYGTIALFSIAGLSVSTLIFISYLTKWFLDKKKLQNNNSDISNEEIEISYSKVGEDNIPKTGIVIDLCTFAQEIGSCLIYLLTLKGWLDVFFEDYSNFIYILLISLLCFLSTRKDFYKLKPLSILKVSSVIYLMVLLIVLALIKIFTIDNTTYIYSPTEAQNHTEATNAFDDQYVTESPDVTEDQYDNEDQYGNEYHNLVKENSDFKLAIGSIVFALGCHQNIVKVFSELKSKKMSQINLVCFFSITVCALIYFIIGICGHYISAGEINANFFEFPIYGSRTFNLHIFFLWGNFGIFCVLLGIFLFYFLILCAFPIQMDATRVSAINILSKFGYKESECEANKDRTKLIVTFVLLFFVVSLSFWPNISPQQIVSLIGSTATNCITYIIPSLLIIYKLNGKRIHIIIYAFLVAMFGSLSMIYMLYCDVTKIINKFNY